MGRAAERALEWEIFHKVSEHKDLPDWLVDALKEKDDVEKSF